MKVDLVFNQVPGSVPGSEGIWRNGDIDPRILEHNTIYIYIYIYIYEVCSNSIRIGIAVVVHWVGCVCNQS